MPHSAFSRSVRQTRAQKRLVEMLEERGRPVIDSHGLFGLVQSIHRDSHAMRLYLRQPRATVRSYSRFKTFLFSRNVIRADRDYRSRFRVLTVPDRPADEIVCLVDPFCHISHLSAMQNWGLTDRRPRALMIARPDNRTIQAQLKKMNLNDRQAPFPRKNVSHPPTARARPVRVHRTGRGAACIRVRGSLARISTIGQTFLDMLLRPDLCGGAAHVLEVWEEHAATYLDAVVEAVDARGSPVAKCRAGYIIEERLGLRRAETAAWKAFAQRGGSRKLDPARAFAPEHSETWMISINV